MNKTHNHISQIVKNNGASIDAHFWVEHNGNVLDYEPNDLAAISPYGSKIIVRKEFSIPLQLEVWKVANRLYQDRMEKIEAANINAGTKIYGFHHRPGNCVLSAMEYKKKNPQAKVKIGSLGFVQRKGDIYYEYG